MRDFIRVNIYNYGKIPYLNIMGPIKNLKIGAGVYNLLKLDSRIDIKTVEEGEKYEREMAKVAEKNAKKAAETKQLQEILEAKKLREEIRLEAEAKAAAALAEEEAERNRLAALAEEEAKIIENTELPVDDIETEVSCDSPDLVIDSTETETTEDIDAAIDAEIENSKLQETNFVVDIKQTDTAIKKYSDVELQEMTKKEMKQILLDRGHIDDSYTGRYHDNLEDLIRKIKETQI